MVAQVLAAHAAQPPVAGLVCRVWQHDLGAGELGDSLGARGFIRTMSEGKTAPENCSPPGKGHATNTARVTFARAGILRK